VLGCSFWCDGGCGGGFFGLLSGIGGIFDVGQYAPLFGVFDTIIQSEKSMVFITIALNVFV